MLGGGARGRAKGRVGKGATHMGPVLLRGLTAQDGGWRDGRFSVVSLHFFIIFNEVIIKIARRNKYY